MSNPTTATSGGTLSEEDLDHSVADEDVDDWMVVPPARGWRLRGPTAVLLALGFAAGGFWTGAVVQRHHGTSTTASAIAARLRAGRTGSGASGFGGFGGFGGGGTTGGSAVGGSATRGTVIDVAGSTVSLNDNTTGAIVKVTIGPSTTVTRTGTGSAGSLQIGDTVVVRGVTGAGGTIAASSIVATAAGVSSSATGFAGGGGGFAGGGGGFGG